MIELSRRDLLTGLASLIAAPEIAQPREKSPDPEFKRQIMNSHYGAASLPEEYWPNT